MTLKKLTLMMLMIMASIAAINFRPTHKVAFQRHGFVLEQVIPKSFDDWHIEDDGYRSIVNPQQAATIKKIYSQTLSRTYINSRGDRVMLAIAYGEDQSDSTQVHYPEFCYPAQGFEIKSGFKSEVSTRFGTIHAKKLIAQLGERIEPITYWTTMGDFVVIGNKETKLAKLKYAMQGKIPDGLLFRVSTISNNPQDAYTLQSKFIAEIADAIDKRFLPVLMGFQIDK